MSNFRIIYTRPEDGGVSIVVPSPEVSLEDAASAVPTGVEYSVVDASEIPEDRFFRNAWEKTNSGVKVNLEKAKGIGHDIRRAERAKEFAPLDIEATIPAKAVEAEAKREVVRAKYAVMQNQIDAAVAPENIKSALGVK